MDPLLIFMLLAVVGMFVLTNRSRKQQRKAVEFRQHLVIGDEVMTGSGMFGTVVDIDGDVIILESSSGTQTDWLRAAIAKRATPPYSEDVEDVEEQDAGTDVTEPGARDLVEGEGQGVTGSRSTDTDPGEARRT
jgi:preprotein translocase subunit YajC